MLGKIVEFRVGEELFVRKCVRHWESGSLVWAAFQGRVFGRGKGYGKNRREELKGNIEI